MLEIDGTHGEGGGQILRGSLALALVTGKAFRIRNIRAGRAKPGLMRQHLTAVAAAARVGSAHVVGATLGSTELTFEPNGVTAGVYDFDIGSAGSTMMVLQAVLPALARLPAPSRLKIIGGTHNPMAPPYEFIVETLAPQLANIGWRCEFNLQRYGFVPAGGGIIAVSIAPAAPPQPLALLDRGEFHSCEARVLITHLARDIAQRELTALQDALPWQHMGGGITQTRDSHGPGNMVSAHLRYQHVTHVVSALGERRRRGEAIAQQVAAEASEFHNYPHAAPVGEYLCDQLLVPLAITGGGQFRCTTWSLHAESQRHVIAQFLGVNVATEHFDNDVVVTVPNKLG
ncbi:MAG: RNA 3'-terminal phosphate cyclase [Kofleriaceae bacterium]|nr:RNA 3'-terminal phosphate cyclase [Kofleriaceae bacterium]